MQEMYQEEFWRKRGRPRELYPDASSKDAPVLSDLPVPNYDCGFPEPYFSIKISQINVNENHLYYNK